MWTLAKLRLSLYSGITFFVNCRFLFCSQRWGVAERQELDEEFTKFFPEAATEVTSDTLVSHITSLATDTKRQQFTLLSTISNYHWIDNIASRSGKKMQKERTRYVNHTVFYPYVLSTNLKHLPTSPRNRLILMTMKEGYENSLCDLVKHLLKEERGPEGDVADTIDVEPPPPKRRRYAVKSVTVSPQTVCDSIGVDLNAVLNSTKSDRPLYDSFKEQLISDGIIQWRMHEEGKDICVMNNINTSTGVLLPSSFVHVTCISQDQEHIVKCSCDIFRLIQRAAKQDVPLIPVEDEDTEVPDASFSCMHCRFYREFLLNAYEEIREETAALSRPLNMVKQSINEMNTPVKLLGDVFPNSTTKFSVRGEHDYAILTFNFRRGKCYAKCLSGMCGAKLLNKKKMPKKVSLAKEMKLCPHMNTLCEHIDTWKGYFPTYFREEDEDEDEEFVNAPQVDDLNMDDDGIEEALTNGNFNLDTGLWEFPALSKHKPYLEHNNPTLIQHTQQRNEFIGSTLFKGNTGRYSHMALLTPVNGRNCECGAGFEGVNPELEGTATLYTRMGPVELRYYNQVCQNGSCKVSYEEAAEEKGIFFWSTQTAAGDEIGWDFINQVMRTKISFTAFCEEMTRKYQTNNIMAAPFMGRKTFIKWFFAWLGAFKIDFRQQVDRWCKYNPKILACDGTHIGVSIRHMDLGQPVTAVDDHDRTLPAKHKRFDRVLLRDKEARKHLRYLCKKYLKKPFKADEVLQANEEEFRNAHLLEFVNSMAEDALTDVMYAFVTKSQHEEVITSLAKLMYMLSGDAAMSSVLPFAGHPTLHNCIRDVRAGQLAQKNAEEMRTYCVEIVDLLQVSVKHECINMITCFLEYLMLRIELVHSTNRATPQATEIPDTYNPASGTCYYFTESGNAVRRMPTYQVSRSGRRRNYDDEPEVDDPCTKMYPSVSFGGFGYMFLWFCPIHGHAYGFHLIAGGEGRKDPFSSLYKYMDTPPEHIFYDFACQLQEYCLNREPELFKNTRFWHDLFHSITHLCGPNFKSGRVTGLEGINSEICEQVNAFLQCIKYTASHLSQQHFVFFVQFFLYLLNKDKTKKFEQQAAVAVAGHL